ncbi:probable glutathione S-transferase GSTU1 [Oryza glaberrima]|uniref:probable glutathione S-transferase GSTU1 n=1 Tax=Oryza glaberrima TaxID=4538 RepID=UPI00224C4669|nr:probable glutathione S-transferase GSTU1 [Oryza glaberrima]
MEGEKKSVVLINCAVSMYGNRVRIALARKGVAYEEKPENLAAKSALLLSSNPVHGQVPVLLVGGKPVCESLVILEFIDEEFAGVGEPLLPAGPYERAQARFWASYIDAKLAPCAGRVWRSPAGSAGSAAVEAARGELVAAMRTLEAELGGRRYFGGGGEALGYVDVALAPFTAWFATYERFGGFSVAAECPELAAWAARCVRENACVAASLPDPEFVYQFACGMRKHFGLDG